MKTKEIHGLLVKTAFFLVACLFVIPMSLRAQQGGDYGDTPEQQEECKKYLSLYRDYRDQNMYEQALPFWRNAYEICPGSAKTLYIDGTRFYGNILDEIYQDSSKLDVRNAYIDTLMQIYDQRIEYFGEEGKVLTYKGNDLYKYDKSRAKEANAMFKRSMELLGNNTDAVALSRYYQSLVDLYNSKEATKSDLLVEYMPVVDILDYNIARLEDEKAKARYESAKTNLENFFVKIADCSDIYSILSERLAEAPEDISLNKKALAVLNKRDCTDDPLYLQVAERVYRDEPTHPAAYSLGIEAVKAKDYSKALTYFREAIELCGDCIDLEKYLLRAGQTATILGQTSTARNYANRILQENPRSGAAYILIGDAIATAAKNCEGPLGPASVYWLAADYYAKAANTDPSVAGEANQKVANTRKYFPLKTDVFFHNLEEGQAYQVECMGGESTTVRTRD